MKQPKEKFLKQAQEMANEQIRILNGHLVRCMGRFAEGVFKLKMEYDDNNK